MASIIEGYKYDIFISYRQKDNKGDRWVSEFVDALKTELESTFKEDVSVYFDINPHDGLLETHDVADSLKEKLKCLIFIPVISRTYCDPKSFAWEHEFIAFVEQASRDQFGMKVKMTGGNVANRVLPVRIHDLDNEDLKLCESVLEGVLRGIEFIYKEPGVNRPLKSTDNKTDNQNKTDYRNQINKVANAVKEIIAALKSPTDKTISPPEQSKSYPSSKKVVSSRKKSAIILTGLIILLTIISIYFYKNHSSANTIVSKSKTIGVIPFANLSSDKEDEYFTEGMCNEILTRLSKIGSLNVISRTSMLQFKGSQKTMKEIGESVGADVLLEGSVQKSNNKVHINVQLIDAKLDKQIWAETYDKNYKDIFSVQSDVANNVAVKLESNITSSEKERIEERPTSNIEAYNLYLKGNYEIEKVTPEAMRIGLEMMNKSIQLDPDFALPYIGIAYYYGVATDFYMAPNIAMPQLKIAAQTAMAKDSTLADAHTLYGMFELWYAWEWEMAKKHYMKAIQLEPNNYLGHLFYSWYFCSQGNLDDAIRESARAVELEPMDAQESSFYALMYYFAGNYDEALNQLDKLSSLNPDYPFAHFFRGQCYVQQGKFKEAITEQKLAHKIFAAPWSLGRIAYAYACAGNRQQAITILDTLKKESATQYVASDVIASVYVALGEKDRAFEYLEKALNERVGWMVFINVDPIWDPIRKDPRFLSVLKRMNLYK